MITAAEAKKIAEESDFIFNRIKEAAERGYPGLRVPTDELLDFTKNRLREAGFVVTDPQKASNSFGLSYTWIVWQ